MESYEFLNGVGRQADLRGKGGRGRQREPAGVKRAVHRPVTFGDGAGRGMFNDLADAEIFKKVAGVRLAHGREDTGKWRIRHEYRGVDLRDSDHPWL